MNRKCQKCDEVLFGAVNRCWKCGTEVEVVATPTIPRIRRSPVTLTTSVAMSSDAAGLRAGNLTGDVVAGVKQILPWFLNMELSDEARHGCAIASASLGAIGCILGIASAWTILFGAVGVVFGLLGMTAKRRDLATMGLVLCVIALFLGFAQIGFGIWTRYAAREMLNEMQGIQ